MLSIKIKKKILFPSLILFLIIALIIGYVILNGSTIIDAFIIFRFLLISFFSTYAILKDSRILSVNKIIWYFCLIFLSIAPLCQYVSGYYPWNYSLQNNEIEAAQWLTILFYGTYFIFYNYILNNIRIKHNGNTGGGLLTNYLCKERDYDSITQLILFACVIMAFILLVRLTGFRNLFIKAQNNVEIENSTIRFVVKKFLSAFPAMACTIFIFGKKRKISKIAFIISAIITVISNFPTSTTRYWMATIILGVFLSKFIKRKESRKYDYAILISVIVIFPLFYIFKAKTLSELLIGGNYSYEGIVKSFNTVDFDAFSMLARATKFVSDRGIVWGRQIINIIFFFIPRSIWQGKPNATNTLIATFQGAKYTNLSCPLQAEGYVNFGVIGVILYSIILAFYSSYLDKLYWITKTESNNNNNILSMIYPYLAIIIFYISRGPLQPAFIQTIALVLPMLVISIIFPSKKEKVKEK